MFALDSGFSGGDVAMRACFHIFCPVYLALGANSLSHFLTQGFFNTRPKSASLEPLMDLPSPKVWLKTQCLTKLKVSEKI